MHTQMLFSRFCTLLCALVTVTTAYTIYFFLIHHCTNSLSSLHIFVHHCTFCASLHTKTSPERPLSLCPDDDVRLYSSGRPTDPIMSFHQNCIVFIHFYSAVQSMNLSGAHPTTATDAVSVVYTPKRLRQLQVKDLPTVPTWRLERDSNPRSKGMDYTYESPHPIVLTEKWIIIIF